MKKIVVVLAMLFGASVSMLVHADASQGGSSGTPQQTQPAAGSDQVGTDDKANKNMNGSGSSNGSSGSSNSNATTDDDDTSS